ADDADPKANDAVVGVPSHLGVAQPDLAAECEHPVAVVATDGQVPAVDARATMDTDTGTVDIVSGHGHVPSDHPAGVDAEAATAGDRDVRHDHLRRGGAANPVVRRIEDLDVADTDQASPQTNAGIADLARTADRDPADIGIEAGRDDGAPVEGVAVQVE